MKNVTGYFIFFALCFFPLFSCSQISLQADQLWNSYPNFKEKSLDKRRIKHKDILPIIEKLKNNDRFNVQKVGESIEGRDLFLIDRKSTRLNSSHVKISYAVFCLKK